MTAIMLARIVTLLADYKKRNYGAVNGSMGCLRKGKMVVERHLRGLANARLFLGAE